MTKNIRAVLIMALERILFTFPFFIRRLKYFRFYFSEEGYDENGDKRFNSHDREMTNENEFCNDRELFTCKDECKGCKQSGE